MECIFGAKEVAEFLREEDTPVLPEVQTVQED
jgi:hypothetical protein